MNPRLSIWLSALLAITGPAGAQGVRPEPRIGYLYPGGARRGSTTELFAGGQSLQGVTEVRVSGTGVSGRIIKTYRPVRNLDGDQRKLLQWHIACRRAELDGDPKPPAPEPPPPNPDGSPAPAVKLPEMPVMDLLGSLDASGIRHWTTHMQRRDRDQPNNQLAESVRVEFKVAADAPAGMREVRFGGPMGWTNPLPFEIATLPEIREFEPNEPQPAANAASAPAATQLPCVFNGQIQSGDVDQFRFRAKRGSQLVVRARARALIPYLADAVPGWFQMVATVRDAKGREIAHGDDFRFDPDPVIAFRAPEDGEYTLEVRDSIYRGREDFVYRIHVGELPFITSIFPLGGAAGTPVTAEIRGWNLPVARVPLDTSSGPVRSTRVFTAAGPSNDVPYAVDNLPEITETEPNHPSESATASAFPVLINGRIDPPGDVDIFRIDGRKDTELAIEVTARRLRSPLDAVVHVADETGRVLAWNDDLMEKDGHLHLGDGLLTHHADPGVRLKIPADGPLFIRIADTRNHGGPDHGYRLRIGNARPDFELRVTPSVVNASPGGHIPLRVHVLRHDGFQDAIRLSLKDAPQGYRLTGDSIPAGAGQARVTLFVPPGGAPGLIAPTLLGTANCGETVVTRRAQPADDTMQAFLWRHLLPAREWLVCVAPGRGRRAPVELATGTPIRLAASGAAAVRVKLPEWMLAREPQPELNEAPPGITVSTTRPVRGGIEFDLRADPGVVPGFQTNLIVDLFATGRPGGKDGKPSRAAGRTHITTLPALPITITPSTQP